MLTQSKKEFIEFTLSAACCTSRKISDSIISIPGR